MPEPDAVETFFSSQPPAPEPSDAWIDISGHHAPDPGTHRARRLTLLIALGAALLIGGFVAYNKLVMPTPETLGGGSVSLPTPQAWPEELPAEGSAEAQAPSDEVAQVQAPAEAPEPEPEAHAQQNAVEAPEAQAPEAEAPEAADPVAAAYEALIAEARGKGFRRSAQQAYMRALAVKPDGDQALSGLAMWFLNQGKNKQALARAQQAVALQPKNSEGWIVLGAARDGTGDHAGARDAYRECVQQGEGRYVVECRRMLR